ncbi:hypothetical protein A6J71_00150 [Enterobacter cancerogenus]|uniref:hypothetical protein n=1 Tax=Enterobacter cancerogenus TaxID=69218 RepID=UPI000C9A5844|nr:hypothetical protein [Enterobacter cancerogenus]PNF13487.1 hypothetical protein A6J71_00150 [Enterobacter cancerogenus]
MAGVTTCIGLPPANEWCALTEPAITLNFGSQTLANAPSARVSATTHVECTTGMKYTLRLRGLNAIPLANGMEASLTANGEDLGATLNGESGLNAVTLAASLTGTPRSGSLNGNGVLFVSYP